MKGTFKRFVAAMLILCLCLTGFSGSLAGEATEIINLEVNGLTEPLGIDADSYYFSWQMDSDAIGAKQTAYQITVADEDGNAIWDSGLVESAESDSILYEGDTLSATTAYTWTVAVTDGDGDTHEASSSFETGLMSGSLDAWEGAIFIGADELTLDATSAAYFDMSVDVQIAQGSTSAAIILGADDFRLQNDVYNIWRYEGENYFKFEIDITDPDSAVLNIYVVGMPANGQDEENDAAEADFSYEISSDVINADNAYEPISVSIDTLSNINKVSVTINGTAIASGEQLNPLGGSHDYNSFPNLNSIGFAVEAGQEVVYTNYTVHNPGQYSTGILFDETTGATWAIWDGIDGVVISDGAITVTGGDEGVLAYADPSYGSAPMVRTEFSLGSEIESARLYVSAYGIYELYLNGEYITEEDYLNPGNSEYRESLAYQTYDITDVLVEGDNAIGAQLAEGWFSGYQTYTASTYNYYGTQQALIAMIVVEYADGTTETIVTDESWDYYGEGPVEYASFYMGERYNAVTAAAMEGWDEAGYDTSDWRSATEIEPNAIMDNFEMFTSYDNAGSVVNELVAVSVTESRDGSLTYIYDMGENVIGVPEITIPDGYVTEGTELTIRYAEILYPELEEYIEDDIDGLMMVENLRAALSTDFYTAVDGEQVFSPTQTYHGYRYIEITGLSEALPIECVKTLVLSSVEVTSTYESSNELAERLFQNVLNSQTSNFLSLITDCPQRNERMGWLGDAQVFSLAASYNADVYSIYRELCQDIRQEQDESGALPVYAPSYPSYDTESGEYSLIIGGFSGISWSGAIALIPYNMYLTYGRTEIIEENLDAIVAYLDYLYELPLSLGVDNGDGTYEAVDVYGLTSETGMLADWLSRISTDASLINNAVFVYLMGITAEMAEAVGEDEIAATFYARYEEGKAAWNEVYIDPETGMTRSAATYAVAGGFGGWGGFGGESDSEEEQEPVYTEGEIQNTQASYVTAIRYGIISDENLDAALEYYVATVTDPEEYSDDMGDVTAYTLTTGFSGTPNLIPVLTEYGYTEEAYAMFEQTEYASWLYPVTQGATSIWERWNSYTLENGFGGNNSMNSFNHFSLGAISEWMMAYHVGISYDEENPGYQEFILQPTVGGTFTYANGSFESNYGTIYSGWTAEDGVITSYECTVPANSSATLYLPYEATDVQTVDGAEYIGIEEHNGTQCSVFTLVSGSYAFAIDGGVVTVSYAD